MSVTVVGRILNRFTKDVSTMDDSMPDDVYNFLDVSCFYAITMLYLLFSVVFKSWAWFFSLVLSVYGPSFQRYFPSAVYCLYALALHQLLVL